MYFGELMEVILYVEDMDKLVQFYQTVMGFEVTYPQGLDDYSGQSWVTFNTGSCTLALHGGGQGRYGKDAPKLVFRVSDLTAARQHLADHGVAVGKVRIAAPGVSVCDVHDPEGNKFSIEKHNSS